MSQFVEHRPIRTSDIPAREARVNRASQDLAKSIDGLREVVLKIQDRIADVLSPEPEEMIKRASDVEIAPCCEMEARIITQRSGVDEIARLGNSILNRLEI